MKKSFLSLLLIIGIVIVSSGQKTIREWSELDDKKFTKKWTYLNTLNYLKTSVKKGWISKDQIPEVKEIGILGITLFQPTFTDVKGVTVLNVYTPFLTSAGSVTLIDELGKYIIPGMLEACKSNGITLSSPENYLNSGEKQKTYDNYEWEPSKLMGATASIASFIRSPQTQYDPEASWGKMVMMADSDIKTWRDIGSLSSQLDLDMMAVVEQTVFFDGKKKSSYLGPIKIVLIGPNPTPKTDEVKYAPIGPLKGYIEGFIYGAVTVTPPEQYEISRIAEEEVDGSKEKIDHLYFDDLTSLNEIYSRITSHLIEYMNAEIADIKE